MIGMALSSSLRRIYLPPGNSADFGVVILSASRGGGGEIIERRRRSRCEKGRRIEARRDRGACRRHSRALVAPFFSPSHHRQRSSGP